MYTDTCTATQTVPNAVIKGGPESQESQKQEFNLTNQKNATENEITTRNTHVTPWEEVATSGKA